MDFQKTLRNVVFSFHFHFAKKLPSADFQKIAFGLVFLYVWGVWRVAKINFSSSVFAPRRKRYYMQPRCDFLQNIISGKWKIALAQMAPNVVISTPDAISRKSVFAARKSWKCPNTIGLAGDF